MGKRLTLVVLMACAALTAISPVMAQSRASGGSSLKDEMSEQVGQLNMAIDASDSLKMKQYLVSVRDQANVLLSSSTPTQEDSSNTRKKLNYALTLANDFKTVGSKLWTNSPFVVYNVPAISPVKRLPDLLPEDGEISDQLSVISAQGEFEAASFVLAPLGDVDAVTFTVSDLTGEKSTIPANAVDLRVVKTWYQGGTAWYSYFADSSKSVLVPELLLHDENLIRVDHARKGNSLRIDYPDGTKYVDISNIPATKFNTYVEPVADSPTLLPIALRQGESKQMWLTSHVPSETPAGTYTGTIDIFADGISAGQISLTIRVLPFELPKPKTYYDLNKDFYVMLYHQSRVKENLKTANGNMKLVETKLLNDYRNLVNHNVLHIPGPYYSIEDKATFTKQLELMQQAGLSLNPLFGVKQAFAPYAIYTKYTGYLSAKAAYEANPTEENKLKMDKLYTEWRNGVNAHKASLDEAIDFVANFVGHTNFYFDGWDEPGWTMLQFEQEMWQYLQD